MRTDELDFHLPAELIAQHPPPQRAASRLLYYRTTDRSMHHRSFAELPSILRPGDLLVFNDAKVLPARLTFRKESGGLVEGLYLGLSETGAWRVLLKNVGNNPVGRRLTFADHPIAAAIEAHRAEGEFELRVDTDRSAPEVLALVGRMPLPPYIRRQKHHDPNDDVDRDRYQTVYARSAGSVAAPTAGLHFTAALMDELSARGIDRTFVTLHVGVGTFKPVSAETLEAHRMHAETYSIPPEAAEALNRAKRERRRIVPVGTTAARVLESQDGHSFVAKSAETAIFIYPPYRWKHVSALVTNFHLPRSTLIALVAALTGIDEQRRIYAEAVARRYRFFSYGDAMFVD
jgi:S-adenosylmethionine:tRNA ribosyltransferase-isomerase